MNNQPARTFVLIAIIVTILVYMHFIRQTSDYAWIGAATYAQDVKQGDKALVTQCVRNYGKEGKVGMLLKLEKADDAAVSYPFVMLDETYVFARSSVDVNFRQILPR